MTVMDTARAWNKLLANSAAKVAQDKFHKGQRYKGYQWLGKQLGKDANTIKEYVEMIDEPEFVKQIP